MAHIKLRPPFGSRGQSVCRGKVQSRHIKRTFSREAAGQKELEDISKAVVRESAKGADPARLERLKTAVADRSYHIPNGALADAILNRAFLR